MGKKKGKSDGETTEASNLCHYSLDGFLLCLIDHRLLAARSQEDAGVKPTVVRTAQQFWSALRNKQRLDLTWLSFMKY